MNFLQDAQIIIPEITGIALTVFGDKEDELEAFEKKYCFSRTLQPMYSKEGLQSFFLQKDEGKVYLVTDALDIRAIVFNIKGQWVFLGPYVTTPWREAAAKILLARRGAKETSLMPYKLYRCGLPLAVQSDVQNIALLLINNAGDSPPDKPVYIDLTVQKPEDLPDSMPYALSNPDMVYRNYIMEAELMDAIRQGDAAQAIKLLNVGKDFRFESRGIQFLSDNLTDQIAGAFAVRVLVRHAAVQAGLTPIFVDALSQEYAQKMHHAKDEAQLRNLMQQYIVAFCHAIQESQKKDYSLYTKRALQYIELRLSQPIEAADLSKLNNISRQYFSQLFKSETGKTVKQYIMQARCDRAAELLENSSLPISEISRYVGYNDANYFARVFKTIKGMTPQEYRKAEVFY